MKSLETLRKEIADLNRYFYQHGWSLATSGNYSVRISETQILITASSLDKSSLSENDTLVIDLAGNVVGGEPAIKPSAESILHCSLYRQSPDINAVLHTHSIYATVISLTAQQQVVLSDYEMLKALRGVTTHQHREIIPIFPNSQDMNELSAAAGAYLEKNRGAHGFLIRAHGLYSWGQDLAEAKRHTEALEFLLECEYRRKKS